jgi:hypothetical protein
MAEATDANISCSLDWQYGPIGSPVYPLATVIRRLGKIVQILEKVAKTIAKPKNTKISSPKINLKVQNIYIELLLNSKNTYNKPYFPKKIHPGL